MKRTFADLHLCLNLKDAVAASRVIGKSATLGYGLIAVSFSPETREAECAELRNVCASMGIDMASRVDLHPRTREQL